MGKEQPHLPRRKGHGGNPCPALPRASSTRPGSSTSSSGPASLASCLTTRRPKTSSRCVGAESERARRILTTLLNEGKRMDQVLPIHQLNEELARPQHAYPHLIQSGSFHGSLAIPSKPRSPPPRSCHLRHRHAVRHSYLPPAYRCCLLLISLVRVSEHHRLGLRLGRCACAIMQPINVSERRVSMSSSVRC